MEKIDIIKKQDPRSLKYESPDISKLILLRTDERTVFYFHSEDQKRRFIKKFHNKEIRINFKQLKTINNETVNIRANQQHGYRNHASNIEK